MLGHNRQTVKLGRGTYRPDYSARLRALRMAAQLPQPPTAADNTGGVIEWGMLANDTLSDCTCAAVLHALQVAQLSQPPHTLPLYTPAEAISLYSRWCGYVPGKPSTDEGGVEADIIDDWTRDTCEGVPLLAHADIGQADLIDTARAIAFYGCAYVGIELPLSAQDQQVWDIDTTPRGEPGSWGGHAVILVRYDPGHCWCVTWGILQPMTMAFAQRYISETHALLLPTWLPPQGLTTALLQLAIGSL